MRKGFLQAGSLLIAVVTSINYCAARPGAHKHHHGQRLPREIAIVDVNLGSDSTDVSYKDHCGKSIRIRSICL